MIGLEMDPVMPSTRPMPGTTRAIPRALKTVTVWEVLKTTEKWRVRVSVALFHPRAE